MFKSSICLCLSSVLFLPLPNSKYASASSHSYSGRPIKEQSSIKRSWDRRSKSLNPRTKNYPKNKIDLLRRILAGSPADEVAKEFERMRSSQIDYVNMFDYDQTLIQAFVAGAVERKDNSQLVYLLSGKCPRYVGAVPIELYLAIPSANNLLILFESYNQSASEDAKQTIMEALSSVFRTLRAKSKDEKAFIDACKKWYLDNRSRLKVNPYYQPRAAGPITGRFFIER